MTDSFSSSPNATPPSPFGLQNQPISPNPSAPFGMDALNLYATSGRKNTLRIVTAALSAAAAAIVIAGCFFPFIDPGSRDSEIISERYTLASFGGGHFFLFLFIAITVFSFLPLVLRRHRTGASQWSPCTAYLLSSGAVLATWIGEKRTTFRGKKEYPLTPGLGFWLLLVGAILLLVSGILAIVLATKGTPRMIGVAYLRTPPNQPPADFAGRPQATGNAFAAEGTRPEPSYTQGPRDLGDERTGPPTGSSHAGQGPGAPSRSFRPPYGSVN